MAAVISAITPSDISPFNAPDSKLTPAAATLAAVPVPDRDTIILLRAKLYWSILPNAPLKISPSPLFAANCF